MIRLLLLSVLILLLLSCTCDSIRPDPLAINLDDVEWGDPGDGSIAPAGTRTSLQSTDPNRVGLATMRGFLPMASLISTDTRMTNM